MTLPTRWYSAEKRADAIDLVRGGRTFAAAARETGMHVNAAKSAYYRWRNSRPARELAMDEFLTRAA